MPGITPTLPQPEQTVSILLVCPDPQHFASLQAILERSNWRLRKASNCAEARAVIQSQEVPVIICERNLSDGDWKALLDMASAQEHPPKLIVSSRLADEYLWAEVLNLGGYDVLMTPFDATEVFRVAFLAGDSWRRDPERARR